MKIRTLVATAAVLALGLAGCSGGGDASTSPKDSGDASAPSEPVTITYTHRLPDGEGMTKVAGIVKKWNDENPNIQVKATKFDGQAGEMVKRLDTDIKAGKGPCLAQVGYAEVPSLFSKGLLVDVTGEVEKYADHFGEGGIGLMHVGDVGVGLPQDTGPLVYYYNKAEFEKLGLKVPTTADELLQTAKDAAAKGKYVIDFQSDEAQAQLSALAAAAGAQWYKAENDAWTVDVTSKETQKVTDFWQAALDAKAALVEPRWGDGFKQALVSQKLIGTIGAAWEAPLLSGDMAGTPNDGQWQVVQLPKFGDEAMSGPDGGSGVAVMKGCEHPAEAMQFNDWFNTQIDDLATQGLVVAAKGDVKTPEDVAKFYGGQEVMKELAKANEIMNPDFGYIPTWPAVADPMSKGAAAAGSGTGKVAAIFEGAQNESLKSLKEAGMPVNE